MFGFERPVVGDQDQVYVYGDEVKIPTSLSTMGVQVKFLSGPAVNTAGS